MATPEAVAGAIAIYREAERRFRRRAELEKRVNHPFGARIARRFAYQAGLAADRNEAGADPDDWERAGTPVIDPRDGGKNER